MRVELYSYAAWQPSITARRVSPPDTCAATSCRVGAFPLQDESKALSADLGALWACAEVGPSWQMRQERCHHASDGQWVEGAAEGTRGRAYANDVREVLGHTRWRAQRLERQHSMVGEVVGRLLPSVTQLLKRHKVLACTDGRGAVGAQHLEGQRAQRLVRDAKGEVCKEAIAHWLRLTKPQRAELTTAVGESCDMGAVLVEQELR